MTRYLLLVFCIRNFYHLKNTIRSSQYFVKNFFILSCSVGLFLATINCVFIAAVGYCIMKFQQEKGDWKQKVGQALAQDEEEVIHARLH